MRLFASYSYAVICWMCLISLSIDNAYGNENDSFPYEETVETYVDYPLGTISQSLLQSQNVEHTVSLSLWSTADDFQVPLFNLIKGIVRRLGKDLLIFEPHYFIVDGRDAGCRVVDPVSGHEVENTENPGCQQNCTNHGRYCAATTVPQDPSLAASLDGASIVEESLRRLCVWDVYGRTEGANSLHFWNYIDDAAFEQCNVPFSKNCTYSIMDRIGVRTHFIERCMNHTHGLDADMENPYFNQQLHQGSELTASMVPVLKIGDDWYDREQSTAEIFRLICETYPAESEPIACDFCKDCNDVRYCLWFLQCDGRTFEMYAASKINNGFVPDSSNSGQNSQLPSSGQDQGAPNGSDGDNNGGSVAGSSIANTPAETIHLATPSPTATSSTPAAFTTTNNSNGNGNAGSINGGADSSQNQNRSYNQAGGESSQEKARDALFRGILVGLTTSVLVTIFFGCRDWQAQIVLREIIKEDAIWAATKEIRLDDTFQSPHNSQQSNVNLQNSSSPLDDSDSSLDPENILNEFSECSTKISFYMRRNVPPKSVFV